MAPPAERALPFAPCAPPQGYHECADAVQVGKPATVEEVQEMVRHPASVAAGGHGTCISTLSLDLPPMVRRVAPNRRLPVLR